MSHLPLDLIVEKLDAYLPEAGSLTVEELVDCLSAIPSFTEHQSDHFLKILNDGAYLRDPNPHDSTRISKASFILWSMLYTKTRSKVKAHYFALMVLPPELDKIGPADQDFGPLISTLVGFASKLVNQYEPELSKLPPELEEDDMLQYDQSVRDMIESFLESVFTVNNSLTRAEFIRQISTVGRWIFNPQVIRDKLQAVAIDSL